MYIVHELDEMRHTEMQDLYNREPSLCILWFTGLLMYKTISTTIGCLHCGINYWVVDHNLCVDPSSGSRRNV